MNILVRVQYSNQQSTIWRLIGDLQLTVLANINGKYSYMYFVCENGYLYLKNVYFLMKIFILRPLPKVLPVTGSFLQNYNAFNVKICCKSALFSMGGTIERAHSNVK